MLLLSTAGVAYATLFFMQGCIAATLWCFVLLPIVHVNSLSVV